MRPINELANFNKINAYSEDQFLQAKPISVQMIEMNSNID